MNLIIFVICFTFIIMVFMAFVVKKKKHSFLDRYTDKLGIISTIFIPIGIFVTYKVFALQFDAMARDTTYKLIDRSWLTINKQMVDQYNECPTFINSLSFDWQRKVLGSSGISNVPDKWQSVNYLSVLIFQSWEDWLTSAYIDQTEHDVWINNFLTWANSDILRNNWSVLKSNYAHATQRLGDYLFHTASTYHPKNDAELNSISELTAKSESMQQILTMRLNKD